MAINKRNALGDDIPPEIVLARALAGESTESIITGQERAGGRALRTTDVLPIKGLMQHKEALERLGFVIGEPADDLFMNVTMPDGWRKEDDGHPYGYWTNLIDPAGNQRANIFYKAAFYDRAAHISFTHRLQARTKRGRGDEQDYDATEGRVEVTDTETGAVVWASPWYPTPSSEPNDEKRRQLWNQESAYDQQAEVFLTTNYPDHRNPFAYWGEPLPAPQQTPT